MTEVVDLSQEIYHKHPVHELHQSTAIWTHHDYEEGAEILGDSLKTDDPPFVYSTKSILMNDHGPTHVDAFAHFGPDGQTIDEMDLSYFFGPGKAIEITKYDGASDQEITVNDMQDACSDAGVEIEEGDTLLINTGHYNENNPSKAYVDDYIGFSREAARWMVDQGIKNFGVDAPGPDNSNDLTFPTHQVCREQNVPHIENLKNIDKVVGKSFDFYGFPLKIRGGTGGPMRAVAIVDK
jgi:kynurenine formamidase